MKVFLDRKNECYVDLKMKVIPPNYIGTDDRRQRMFMYLVQHAGEVCSYSELEAFDSSYNEISEDINEIRKYYREKCGLKVGTSPQAMDDGETDFVICRAGTVTGERGYVLLLPSQAVAVEQICQQIADAYYEKYKAIHLLNESNEVNRSLIEVFCFPNFVRGERLDLSEDSNVFICAPNGFGKSTLLKAILLAANPSSKINKKQELMERMLELKNYYGINEDYLTLFIDLKELNNQNAFKSEEDLCKWLLFASHLDNLNGLKIKLDEFRELVKYYNQKERLMLIFDSVDEIIQDREIDIGREEVLEKIRLLISADEICCNAKVIVASRPLVFNEDNMPYKYLYIESLISNQERVKTIIEKYSPEHKDDLVHYIYEDLYLKYLVVTPQLLIDVISRILLNKYNENMGISGEGKYKLIKSVIRNTMMRFKNKGNFNYLEKNYEHIYEIFSYVSLFNNVQNRRDDFAEVQELILSNELNYAEKRKKPIDSNDIIEAYEHFCLFNTQSHNLELLAAEVLGPYYLAGYMYKVCALSMNEERQDETQIWKNFETILKNKYRKEDYLYDMLVFFFGIIHEGIAEGQRYNPDSLEYNVWIDYVVYKWNSVSDCATSRKILIERLKYLLESDFVKDSCFERILSSDSELSENEMQLKVILNEI